MLPTTLCCTKVGDTMREFVFRIEYEPGSNEVMDLFIEYPELYSRTMAIHATTESTWRLERITGSSEALDYFDDLLEEVTLCNEVTNMCDGSILEWNYDVLSRTPNSRNVYIYRSEGEGMRSIPHVAAKHIGDGVLMRAERRGRVYRWILLIEEDDTVGAIYEELDEHLREGLTLDVRRLSDPELWSGVRFESDELPPEQRAALEAAVEHGYYRTPRQHSLQDISEKLGIPNSTLQYRLTRAEAWLARQFVSEVPGTNQETSGKTEKTQLRQEK